MATYLRFTTTAQEDIDRGTSLFKTPSMKKAIVLDGICAFRIDLDNLTEEQIIKKVNDFASAYSYYSDCGTAAIIEGAYINQNANGEGVIISPEYLIREISL